MYIKDIYIVCLAYRIRFYIYIPEYLGMAAIASLAVKAFTTVCNQMKDQIHPLDKTGTVY